MAQGKGEKFTFEPRVIKEDDLLGPKAGYTLKIIKPNVYQFISRGAGCHIYLIIGDDLNVLIDTGLIEKFNSFNYLLTTEVGLKVEDIDLVINTHEHFDHISSNAYFTCPIAAHRWAAVKIQNSDEFITKGKQWGVDLDDLRINIWLEDRTILDLGNYFLKVVQTPGHTSGSICLYEPYKFYMFTGDTLFKSTLSNIYESGSLSEYINSLQILNTLKIHDFYPSHGPYVIGEENVEKQIEIAISGAKDALDNYVENVKCKTLADLQIPESLYDRDLKDNE